MGNTRPGGSGRGRRPAGRVTRPAGGKGPPAGGAVPPVSYKGKGAKGGGGCEVAVPVAVFLTLFYALPRMAWDTWKEKRSA